MVKCFILNSRLPQTAPRTPKDVSAAGTDSDFMNFSEAAQTQKTGWIRLERVSWVGPTAEGSNDGAFGFCGA